MLTDEDVEKIASSVFAKLVARWDERSAEAQKRKKEREEEKERLKAEEEDRRKERKRNRLTSVQRRMVAALNIFDHSVYEREWRAMYAELNQSTPTALRVTFGRHRDWLIDNGHVINDNERFSVASQKAPQKTPHLSHLPQN
jgi:hypothetical protein